MATAPQSTRTTTLQPGTSIPDQDGPNTNVPSSTPSDDPEPVSSAVLTHSRDPSSIPFAAATLTASFTTDPVLRYVLSTLSSGTLLTSPSFLTRFFHSVTSLAISSSATITCISTPTSLPTNPTPRSPSPYPCVGILASPHHPVGGFSTYLANLHLLLPTCLATGWTRSYKLLITYPSLITPLKRRTFTSRTLKADDFYYVFFLGTVPSARGQGLASAYVRWCQRQAREHVDAKTGQKEGKGVWLECSSEGARRVYEREGFEVVGEVWYGGGECDGEGRVGKEAKGELTGCKVTGMVWWPDEGVRARYGSLDG